MADKVTLVTGATDGIGRQTAKELALLGHHVIVHGRSAKKAKAVRDELSSETGRELDFAVADFASLAEVRALAKDLQQRFPALHVLLNNAGLISNERQESRDGLELTFAVNHLAPFLLTCELLPLLKKSGHARIVNVSSTAHQGGSIDFDDLQRKRGYSGYSAYASSKLMNLLFTFELAERLKGTDVTVNALHPGVIGTKLLRAGFGGMSGASLESGARTSVYVATSPELEGVSGKYFSSSREAPVSSASRDAVAQKRLWELSEALTAA